MSATSVTRSAGLSSARGITSISRLLASRLRKSPVAAATAPPPRSGRRASILGSATRSCDIAAIAARRSATGAPGRNVTISCGALNRAPRPIWSIACSASTAGLCSGSQSPSGVPRSSRVACAPRRTIGIRASSRTARGYAHTSAPQRRHIDRKRARIAAWRRLRGASLGPNRRSTAGVSVRATRTETAVTTSPPMAMERISLMGTTSSAARQAPSETPESRTEPPALRRVRRAARAPSRPSRISSR